MPKPNDIMCQLWCKWRCTFHQKHCFMNVLNNACSWPLKSSVHNSVCAALSVMDFISVGISWALTYSATQSNSVTYCTLVGGWCSSHFKRASKHTRWMFNLLSSDYKKNNYAIAREKYTNYKQKNTTKPPLTFKSVNSDALNLEASSQVKHKGFLGSDFCVSCVMLKTYCILPFVPTH